MVQLRNDLGFALEALFALKTLSEMFAKDFDRDGAVETSVGGFVDLSMRPALIGAVTSYGPSLVPGSMGIGATILGYRRIGSNSNAVHSSANSVNVETSFTNMRLPETVGCVHVELSATS